MKKLKIKSIPIIPSIIVSLVIFLYSSLVAHAKGPSLKFDHLPFIAGRYLQGLAQDKDGFIWIGSAGGAVMYNGYETKEYKAGQNALPSTKTPTVFVDSEGLIWFGTFSGLAVYDKKTDSFTTHTHDPDNPNTPGSNSFDWFPRLITEDKDGLIWFGTMRGLNSYHKTTKTFTRYQHDPNNPKSLSHDHVNTVFVDRDNLVWIGTKEGGLNKFNQNTNTFTHYKHDPQNTNAARDIGKGSVTAVVEDQDGFIWIGTSHSGLKKFDKSEETFTHFSHDPDNPNSLGNNNIQCLVASKFGNLWICHPYFIKVGIESFDRKSQVFTKYQNDPNDPNSVRSDSLQALFEDRSGILWIAESIRFLDKYDPQSRKFNVYTPTKDKYSVIGNVLTTLEDKSKTIWLSSATTGLARYDKERDYFIKYPHDPKFPKDSSVNSIYEDSSGNFWISTSSNILGLFDRNTGKIVRRYEAPVRDIRIWRIMEDPQNANILWLASNVGVFKFDKKTESYTQYKNDSDDPNSIPLGFFRNIVTDNDGDLWITSSVGLIKYNRDTDNFRHYRHNPDDPQSISSDAVCTVFVDSKGSFWVTTEDKLNKFDKNAGTFKAFGQESGFTTNVTLSLLEDNQGHLWVGSDSGIFKFDLSTEKVVKNYLEPGKDLSTYPSSALKASDGELWFSSTIGTTRFHPEKVADNPYVPPVYLTAFTQGGETVDVGRAVEKITEIKLDWQYNYFEFEFAALNYTRPEENLYAYMLEGLDKDWYYAGTKRHGRYAAIPPGSYTLKIKGSNNDGVWNDQGVSVSVIVSAPFWRTSWFYVALTVTGGIFLLMGLFYIKKLQVEIAERKLAEEALRDSEERFDLAMNAAKDGLYDWNLVTNDIYYSPGWKKMLGYEYEELPNDFSVWENLAPEDVRRSWEMRQELVSKKRDRFEIEFKMRHKDGHWVDILSRASAIFDDSGKAVRIVGTHVDITERKRAAQKIEDALGMASNAEKAANMGSWSWDMNSNRAEWSDNMCRLHGIEPSEYEGTFEQAVSFTHPDDASNVNQKIERMLAEKKSQLFEYRIVTPTGLVKWVEGTNRLLFDNKGEIEKVVGTVQDITERKKATQKVEDALEIVSRAEEIAKMGSWSWNPNTDRVEWSDNMCRLYGTEPSEFVPTLEYATRFTHPDDVDYVNKLVESLLTEKKPNSPSEYRILTPENEIVWMEGTTRLLFDDKGDIEEVVGTVQDITDRKKMENQILQTQKMEAIGTLAGGIAHDFNNMLGIIVGNVSYLLNCYGKDEELIEVLSDIQEGAQKSQQLTQQLLTFAKGGAPIKKSADINQIIKEAAKFVTRGAKAKCNFNLSDDLWGAEVDSGQLDQVIGNLVINANQAMPNGGIITIRTENAEIEADGNIPLPAGMYIKIILKDQGIGIPEKHLTNIFDPYFSTKREGRGLGLATSYSIIKRHGGHISAESITDEGTTFTIHLPVSDKAILKAEEKVSLRHAGHGKILVMDDEGPILKMVGRILSEMGYEPYYAEDGKQTLEIYQSALETENPFDMVILDLTIPGGMGGQETLKRLLQMDPDVKAIVSSGYSNDPVMSDYKDHGFCGVIPKPYSQDLVAEVLNKIFSEKA
ncbi:PAS domain-containing protein [Desulfobacterales bacterium HSG2]|nr:PAS domain-containing protein [Desulfobacterales bacterium HSG2]